MILTCDCGSQEFYSRKVRVEYLETNEAQAVVMYVCKTCKRIHFFSMPLEKINYEK